MSRNFLSHEINSIFCPRPDSTLINNAEIGSRQQDMRANKEIQNNELQNHPYRLKIKNKFSNAFGQQVQQINNQSNYFTGNEAANRQPIREEENSIEGITIEDILQNKDRSAKINVNTDEQQCLNDQPQQIETKKEEEDFSQNILNQRKNMTDELGNFVFQQQVEQDSYLEKLNKLTGVFKKIIVDEKIQQFIESEELNKIRNILNFLTQMKLKTINEEASSSLKQAYIQEIQSFISGFGDHQNYDDYYRDLYQQAEQREIELSSGQDHQDNQLQQEVGNQQSDSSQNEVQAKNDTGIFSGSMKSVLERIIQVILSFMKNPINILRCLLLALSLLFFSAYFSIPDMTNQPPTEIFNWLAYNRASRMLVATGSLSFCCFVLFGVRQLYILIIGDFRGDQEKAILNLYLEQNPILHISIIYMTDPNIIPQKFDLAIWLCFYFTFSTFKIFHNVCSQQLKMILQNINDDYQEELKCIVKIQRFSAILFLINLWISSVGLWFFSLSGYYKLSLLFYEGILFAFDSFKIVLCTTKLRDHMNFYVNYNTEEIHDPFFKRETLFDSFYHIVQLFHFIQLMYNYFFKLDYQFIIHLWLLYLFKKINISLKQLKNNFQAYRRYLSIQKNIDNMFPKVDIKELSDDDVCSICHDELLVARRIETCGHKFHIKCLFKWLKSQQNSRCPICRSEIPNLNFDNIPNKPGVLTLAIDYLARIFSPTINFIFETRPTQNENQTGNNLNENIDNDNQDLLGVENDSHINQNELHNNGNNNYQRSNRNNLGQDDNPNLSELLNQNYYDSRDRDLQMYQQISQLVTSQSSNQKNNQISQLNEGDQTEQERQALRDHIKEVIRYNLQSEAQDQKQQMGNKYKEEDEEEEEDDEEDYENFEFNEQNLLNDPHNGEQFTQELRTMSSSKEQLLNLKSDLLSLQDQIISKDTEVNTEAVLKHFQQRLEREQQNLINFLMRKLQQEEQAALQNPQLIQLQQEGLVSQQSPQQIQYQQEQPTYENEMSQQILKQQFDDSINKDQIQHQDNSNFNIQQNNSNSNQIIFQNNNEEQEQEEEEEEEEKNNTQSQNINKENSNGDYQIEDNEQEERDGLNEIINDNEENLLQQKEEYNIQLQQQKEQEEKQQQQQFQEQNFLIKNTNNQQEEIYLPNEKQSELIEQPQINNEYHENQSIQTYLYQEINQIEDFKDIEIQKTTEIDEEKTDSQTNNDTQQELKNIQSTQQFDAEMPE